MRTSKQSLPYAILLYLTIPAMLLTSLASCIQAEKEGDDDIIGGKDPLEIYTLRSIQWQEGERTDSIRFIVSSNSATGLTAALQEYYEGANRVSRKMTTSESGITIYNLDNLGNREPLFGIRTDAKNKDNLLLYRAETPTIADTLKIKSLTSRSLITEIRYVNGGADTFEYNDKGNLIKKTTKDGSVTTYTYDDKIGFWSIKEDRYAWVYCALNVLFDKPANVVNNVLAETTTDKAGNTTATAYSYTYNNQNIPLTMKASINGKAEKVYKINYDITINY